MKFIIRKVSNKMDYDIEKGTIYKLLSSGFPGERKHFIRQHLKQQEKTTDRFRKRENSGPYKEGMDILENWKQRRICLIKKDY